MLKIIDNFTGRLTRNSIGDMNSGLAKFTTTYGNDPFSNVSSLTWLETPTQIDSGVSVIQDLIMCQKTRLESGITYVYAVGHTGRVYKIQVNDPATHNPNYDNPVLLTTLTTSPFGAPTLKYGGSIQFFGNTPRIYICHDFGVSYINFDGTGETYITNSAANGQNCARPSVVFQNSLFTGGQGSLVQINGTPIVVSTFAPNVPGFPSTSYVRDLDISPDGNYIQIIVSELNSPDLTISSQDTTSLSSGVSLKLLWNGATNSPTSYASFNAYSINSNITFGPYSYTTGYDLGGASLYESNTKVLSLPNILSPNFGAMFSTGNMLGFATPETVSASGRLAGSLLLYGQFDNEIPKGLFRFFRQSAEGQETDILQVPSCLIVSNRFYGSSLAGYGNNLVGTAKVYYSTLEVSSSPTTRYKFWKFTTVPTGLGTVIGGIYETQQETSLKLFRSIISRKFKPNQIRFYVQPLANNNSFKIDVIGSDGNPISGCSKTFTVGSNCNVGDDIVQYNPQGGPTFSMGIRITNLGTNNWTGEKMEIDYEEYGVK